MDTGIELFKSSFGCAFNDSRFADTKVTCGDHVFHVHKVILCAHSPVFLKVFSSDWKEAQESKYTIDEESPAVVEAMLYFMYHFEYNGGDLIPARPPPMVFHAQMYAAAELYNIQSLKEYAKTKFRVAVNHAPVWPTEDFGPAVAEVYGSTADDDRELRDFVVDVARRDMAQLSPLASFQAALAETPGFAADVCRALTESMVAQAKQVAALTESAGKLTEQLHETEDALRRELAKKPLVKGSWYQVGCRARRDGACVLQNGLYHVYSTDEGVDGLAVTCKGCGEGGKKLEPLSAENFGRAECMLSEPSPGTPSSSTSSGWCFGPPCSFYGQSTHRS